MDPTHALVPLACLLAGAACVFFLVVLRNPRWYVHVLCFVTGVVTFLLLFALVITAGVLVSWAVYKMIQLGGVWILGSGLLVLALVIGSPVAANYLADLLERNGVPVGPRTYAVLLVAGIPVGPIVAVFASFATLGHRFLRLCGSRISPRAPNLSGSQVPEENATP